MVEKTQPSDAVQGEGKQHPTFTTTPTSNTNRHALNPGLVLVPGFRDLVLRWQEGVVDGCGGGVTKCSQPQEFDLRQTQGAGITRPVQPQANS